MHDEEDEEDEEDEDERDDILILEPAPLALQSPFEALGLGGDEVFELAALLLEPAQSLGLMFK